MIYGIVLGAGRGRRIGTPKALLTLGGDTFHQRTLCAFRNAGLETVMVVNRELMDALAATGPGEHRVVNHDPDQTGMFGSVRLGVEEAIRLGATGVILLPVDHPLVSVEDVRSLAAGLETGAVVAVATHAGRRGHPIGVNRTVMDEIAADPTVNTLRDVVRRDRNRVVEVPCSEGAILGVNTKEDLERVSNRPFR